MLPNRFRNDSNAIVYNVVKIPEGWRVEAKLPKHVSVQDRTTVLNWFQQYRSIVRSANPLWVTSFYSGDQGYFLEVRPVGSPKELLEKGQNLRNIWADEIATRA
jgi:hypothetical protein